MDRALGRRNFLSTAFYSLLIHQSGTDFGEVRQGNPLGRIAGPKIKLSCNAYSFNQQLQQGHMSLAELLEFCAQQGFDGVDLTGYYFAGYPDQPAEDLLFRVKRYAHVLGLEVTGTGVRNDFTQKDQPARLKDIQLVISWLEVAAKLGAPNMRIFAGRELSSELERTERTRFVIQSIQKCVPVAASNGVMLSLQNHAEFIKTPGHIFEILEGVNSPWLAVNLDIGSFRSRDPYAEIAMVAPYAVAWQIKELVYVDGRPTRVDLIKVVEILRDSGYRGHILIETLGEGDPFLKVPRFLNQVREALGKVL